jgi:hypothetical protein
MDKEVRRDAIIEYARKGYVVWPINIPNDLLVRLSVAVNSIQSRVNGFPRELRDLLLFERDLPAKQRGGIDGDQIGDAIFIIGDPIRFSPIFRELVENPIVRQAAVALLDSEDLKVHFINVTIKHPRFGRSIGWHRDYPNTAYCTDGADFLRIMLCLDGMDEASGATSFVPSSQQILDSDATREKALSMWPQPSEEKIHVLTCMPGQMVAIHPKVLHGGKMNISERSRRNIVLQIGKASKPLITKTQESLTGYRL